MVVIVAIEVRVEMVATIGTAVIAATVMRMILGIEVEFVRGFEIDCEELMEWTLLKEQHWIPL